MSSSLALEINEVMYAPNSEQGGAYNEWIEVYNSGNYTIDLTDWTIDKDFDDVNISPGEYLIIARKLIGENSFESVYGNDDGIWDNLDGNYMAIDGSFSLTNSGDTITLTDGNTIISFNYTDETEAKSGNSLQLINNEWFASPPTPGYENILNLEPLVVEDKNKNIILSSYLDEIIYTNNKYTKLFKIEIKNKNGCSEKDDVTVSYSITNQNLVKEDQFTSEVGCTKTASTGELTLTEAGEYTLCGEIVSSTVEETNLDDNAVCFDFTVIDTSTIPCDIAVNVTNEDLFYEKGDSIKFKTQLNNKTFPFQINYWIEDLFGNIVKNEVTTSNTNQKSWKTKIDEQDRVLFIKAELNSFCNDTDLSNNFAEKMFIVTNQETEISVESVSEEDSTLEIVKVPEEAKFGSVVKAEVEIFKGNTNKYSLTAWVEKSGKVISEKTKFHLKDKNTQYKLTLPIQLKPNCDDKIDEGKAEVIVEGLDLRAEKELSLAGINEKLCQTKVEEKIVEKEVLVETSLSGPVDDYFPEKQDHSQSKGVVVYESNSTKAKNIIPYIMAATFGLLCIVLLKRN